MWVRVPPGHQNIPMWCKSSIPTFEVVGLRAIRGMGTKLGNLIMVIIFDSGSEDIGSNPIFPTIKILKYELHRRKNN